MEQLNFDMGQLPTKAKEKHIRRKKFTPRNTQFPLDFNGIARVNELFTKEINEILKMKAIAFSKKNPIMRVDDLYSFLCSKIPSMMSSWKEDMASFKTWVNNKSQFLLIDYLRHFTQFERTKPNQYYREYYIEDLDIEWLEEIEDGYLEEDMSVALEKLGSDEQQIVKDIIVNKTPIVLIGRRTGLDRKQISIMFRIALEKLRMFLELEGMPKTTKYKMGKRIVKNGKHFIEVLGPVNVWFEADTEKDAITKAIRFIYR